MKRLIYLLSMFIASHALGGPVSPNKAAESIVVQLTIPRSAAGLSRMIVPDIRNLDGSVTELGRLLSEEILQAVFHTGNCDIIERLLLDKVIKEQKLSTSGILDPKSTQQLGKLLSADYVLVGILTDMGDAYKLHIRLICTISGSVSQSAAVELVKNHETEALDGRTIQKAALGASGNTVARIRGLAPGTIYFEDFSAYKEGDPLPNWGKAFMVNGSKRFLKNGLSLISGTKEGSTIPQKGFFPKHFYFQVQAETGRWNVFKVMLLSNMSELVCVEVSETNDSLAGFIEANVYLSRERVVSKRLFRWTGSNGLAIRIVVNRGVVKVFLLDDQQSDTYANIWSGPVNGNIDSYVLHMQRSDLNSSILASNIKVVALE